MRFLFILVTVYIDTFYMIMHQTYLYAFIQMNSENGKKGVPFFMKNGSSPTVWNPGSKPLESTWGVE